MKRLFILLLAVCTIGIAQAQVGIYRSTGYGAIKKEKVQRPRKPLPNAMIGVGAGIGLTSSKHVIYPNGTIDFNFAISITPKVALGGFMQWGILENWAFGAQVVAGDYFNHKGAFIGGIGYVMNARGNTHHWPNSNSEFYNYTLREHHYTRDGMNVTRYVLYNREVADGAFIRLGFVAKNNFYMTLDVGIFPDMYRAIIDRYENNKEIYAGKAEFETAATTTLTFGYAFNVAPKQRNKQIKEETAL